MADESIEVVPSVEDGNVPAETPNVATETVAPPEKTETVVPTEPVQELFKLPDGREVDAPTLAKEWKENFLPDYTKKAQALAEIQRSKETPPAQPVNKYSDPDYVPSSYDEIIQAAKQSAIEELESREKAKVAEQRALEDAVSSQLDEVKKIDPSVNENDLFLHATKYGFRSLVQAHANMRDMRDVVKKTQETTAKNIAKRADPVSVNPGATGQRPDPSQFSNALEYFRSLK